MFKYRMTILGYSLVNYQKVSHLFNTKLNDIYIINNF